MSKSIKIENEEWVATTEAASIVGLCGTQFWRLYKQGKLKVKRLKIGTMVIYLKSDLEKVAAERGLTKEDE